MPSRSLSYAFALAAIMGAAPAEWLGRPPAFSRHRDNTAPGLHKRPLTGDRPLAPHPPAPAPTRATGAGLGLVAGVAPPVRPSPVAGPPALVDLLSRVPRPFYWRDEAEPGDLVTWAHEATHGMTGEVSAGGYGLYLLEGRAIVFKNHPRVTIGQVAAMVPQPERGDIFDLYLVKQRGDWDREPLYLLDEWNAYVHGTLTRRQTGQGNRQETERYASEMERYCRWLVKAVERFDPAYPELNRLRAFVEWEADRFAAITGQGGKFVLR
jgi:hypothetical protein